jgi:O-methyltransferase
LKGLARVGVLVEDANSGFRLTPSGRKLRRDDPESIVPLLLEYGSPHVQAAWAEVGHSVRTGRAAFYYALGAEYWAYVGKHPDIAAGAHDRLSLDDRDAVSAHDFSGVDLLVDVGGGQGHLLAAILERNLGMRGILFDLPPLGPARTAFFADAGLADRACFVGGDFFTEVPRGGDAYLLAGILCDWSDTDAVRILRNCRRAMTPASRLVIVEASAAPLPALADLHRMVLFGAAREREAGELRSLAETAGFDVGEVIATPSRPTILEALPAPIDRRDDRIPQRRHEPS